MFQDKSNNDNGLNTDEKTEKKQQHNIEQEEARAREAFVYCSK